MNVFYFIAMFPVINNDYNLLLQELDLMKGDSEVYKLIGPVLVKQELVEAKQNVAKRMDYIKGEL